MSAMHLSHIPIPNREAAPHDLLNDPDAEYGYLKMKKKIHEISLKVDFLKDIISKIKWDNKYVILLKGCVYVYGNSQNKKPERAFSLFGFSQVVHLDEESLKSNWIFKILCFVNERVKSHYFAATCEKEMKKWMVQFEKEMATANQIQLRTEIYTKEFKKEITQSAEFKKSLEGAESDDEYSYIKASAIEELTSDEKGCIERSATPPILASKSSNFAATLPTAHPRVPSKPITPPESEIVSYNTQRELPPLPTSSKPVVPSKPLPQAPVSEKNSEMAVRPRVKPPESDSKSSFDFKTTERNKRPSLKVSPMQDNIKDIQKDLEAEAKWTGNSNEGQMLLVSYAFEGSYMIRKGTTEDIDVLLVFNSSQLKKFRIIINEVEEYSLDGQGRSFDSLNELLNYYHSNNLPNKDFKLIKPYSQL